MKPLTLIGFLGSTLDASKFGPSRWNKWRPTVGVTMHQDLRVDRFLLIHGSAHQRPCRLCGGRHRVGLAGDHGRVAAARFQDPWDFEEVFGKLLDFARAEPFDPEAEDYLVHITTGTHVAQICLFLLTEARYLPGRLLQTQPERGSINPAGTWKHDSTSTCRATTASPRASRSPARRALRSSNPASTRATPPSTA